MSRWLVLASLACGALACNRDPHTGTSVPASAPTSAEVSPGLLERIHRAPETVAFAGTRRVHFQYDLTGTVTVLEYTERVVSAGDGRFAIDPIAVEIPRLSPNESELFELMQKGREGFFYRYRDFRIDDLQLFLARYSIADTGAEPVVAGRKCIELAIHRREPSKSWHRIAVDPDTGLVLRSEELDPAERMLARVEFQDLDLAPDLGGVEFHVARPTSALDLAADARDTVDAPESPGAVGRPGFPVLVPTALPAGYVLRKTEAIEDEVGQRWARLIYSDGVAQVFFMYAEVGPTEDLARAESGGQAASRRGSVRVFEAGPWVVAQGFFDRQRLLVVGKLETSALLAMIDSALP